MANPRILVVDDNVDFGFSLGEILKDEGYEIECVDSGEAALETFQRQAFDLVLLDMKLPRMSGIDALFRLREIDPAARVVMMSGHSLVDLLAQAVEGQTYHLFYPPYQFESLRATVDGMHDIGLVLVADDSPGLASRLVEVMVEQGRRAIVAEDRSTALEKVTANEGELLILDMGGPIFDALEVFWKLKRAHRTLPTVVIVPPPGDRFRSIERLNQFPASGYFIKPFNPLDMLPAIESMVR